MLTNHKRCGNITKLIQMSEKLKQLKQFEKTSLKTFLKKCLTKSWECDKITKSLREQQKRTLIIKQWNNPENSMNFHSKNWQRCQALETVKNCEKSQYGTNLCFLGNKKPEVSSEKGNKHFNMRVWSWLRMNAGGVLNTCKSNEAPWNASSDKWIGDLVADGWVTRG